MQTEKQQALSLLATKINEQIKDRYASVNALNYLQKQVDFLVSEVKRLNQKIESLEHPEPADTMPSIARKVWLALEGGPASAKQLVIATGYKLKTVRAGVDHLRKAKLITGYYDVSILHGSRYLYKRL
jgi:hypothetical protein